MTTAHDIAEFALTTSFDSLAKDIVEALKKRFLDGVAIATGAIGEPPIQKLLTTTQTLNPDGNCQIWGYDATTSPLLATAVNGGMVRYLDFMDAYLVPDEVPHPSNNVAPVLVTGEYVDATGRELIEALGIAYEIHYQLAKHAPLMDRGWDHGTYVTFSAAAAVGKLLGLDQDALMNAIGISGVAHNALRVTRTGALSEWKGLSAANAARNAIYAAMVAKNGITGPTDVFEGENGWKDVIAGPFNVSYGPCDAVLKVMTKKYMAGTVAQSALECLATLMDDHTIDASDIESMRLDTFERAKRIMGGTGQPDEAGDRYRVTSREDADHSLHYTLAAFALDGQLSHDQYALDRIQRSDVQSLLHRIEITATDELTAQYNAGEMPATLTVTVSDGTTYTHETRAFDGHPTQPITWSQLEEKSRSMMTEHYSTDRIESILETIHTLETRDASDIIAVLSPD